MRRSPVTLMLVALIVPVLPLLALAQPLAGQTPRPTAAPEVATPGRPEQEPKPQAATPKVQYREMTRPETPGQPINVKVEFTITDQYGAAAPVQKTVSLVLADRESGMIRSEGQMPGYGAVQLHVDAEVRLLADGKIRARIGLNYDLVDPKAASAERQSQRTQIREGLAAILENGKPQMISQSADPVTDRKVTVEVKGTILK